MHSPPRGAEPPQPPPAAMSAMSLTVAQREALLAQTLRAATPRASVDRHLGRPKLKAKPTQEEDEERCRRLASLFGKQQQSSSPADDGMEDEPSPQLSPQALPRSPTQQAEAGTESYP